MCCYKLKLFVSVGMHTLGVLCTHTTEFRVSLEDFPQLFRLSIYNLQQRQVRIATCNTALVMDTFLAGKNYSSVFFQLLHPLS